MTAKFCGDMLGSAEFHINQRKSKLKGVQMPENQYLKIKDVCRVTTLSQATIYELMGRKQFPRPLKIAGTRRVAWTASTVENWLKNQDKETA